MTHDHDHAWAKGLLAEYLVGGLSPDERKRIEVHVDTCDECSIEVDELSKHDLTLEEVPPTLKERILSYRPGPAARAILAAAAVVLLGIIGFIIVEREPGGMLGGERLMAVNSGEIEVEAVTIPAPVEERRYADVFERRGIPRDLSRADIVEPAIFFPEARESDHNESHRVMATESVIWGAPSGNRTIRPMGQGGGSGYGGGLPTGKVYVPGKNEMADPERAETEERRRAAVFDAIRNQEEAVRAQRKIVRTGDMEFEIESFDAAVALVVKITLEEKGYVATINSEKLQNGKVRGSVVVRIPPDHLDTLILKLRALGDLRSQKIGSEDVTRAYTDLESRLRAARTMEERLLNIIKEGKGQIKDLLLAEKELGEWRTRIESMVGEITYYNNQIAHSTLLLTLTEKEIRAPFAVVETERVDMAVEVDDVENAHREMLSAVAEAKGRVIRSDLRQVTSDQFQATIQFEVAPDRAGALRDRAKQMGILARLDLHRVQEKQGGPGNPQQAGVRQGDTQVTLGFTNAAELIPRETIHLTLACIDAEQSYKALIDRIEKSGRVYSSQLTRQKKDQTTGTLICQIRTAEADAALADFRAVGDVLKLDSREATAGSTRAKRGFVITVHGLGSVQPRETSTIVIASRNVASGYRELLDAAKAADARILNAELNESDRKKMAATLSIDLRRDREKTVAEAMARAGDVYTRSSTRAQDSDTVIDSKTVLHFRLFDAANIPARETVKLSVEAGDVEATAKALEGQFPGRVVDTRHSREASGERESVLTLDVPLKELPAAVDRVKALGILGEQSSARNAGVPDNDLAVARLEVRIANRVLLPDTSGPWANIRKGFAFSLQAASWSLMLIMVGICFVLPLVLMGWGVMRIRRKFRPRVEPAA